MKVKHLGGIDFGDLIDTFLTAFENYFVKMPTDKNYYQKRWEAAKVDLSLSYGMFDQERLVGFIINAIDRRNGVMTAYNTGTGVLPEYRGRKIVKAIYDYALPELKRNGIDKCSLEVITENNIAIKAYQSIGFEICKTYKCFKGTINLEPSDPIELEAIEYNKIDWKNIPHQEFYSWDNQKESIQKGNYTFFTISNAKTSESFFALNPDNGSVAQFELLSEINNGWDRLFAGIHQISPTVKINNVDERHTDKIDYLTNIGLVNTVDQYEMEFAIDGGLNG